MFCVCSEEEEEEKEEEEEEEEEIATIPLDVSRVVRPPADDGRGAETHHIAYSFITLALYAVGMYYLLGAESSNRGPELPTLWSQYVSYNIKA